MRGRGADDRINRFLRGTPFRERGESSWTVDDLVRYDMPAILDYVERETGQGRVNWVGHSLGGMMMFPFLELSTEPERIANFVGMGSTIIQAGAPRRDMLAANASIRGLLTVASAGRLGRPLTFFRMPGMASIDKFYYSAENVDRRTISRFYGYTLEDPGPGALRQFSPYLRNGHLLSADGKIDYSARLGEVTVPTLMVAGAGDLISDVPSTRKTFDALGSADKTLYVFGKASGHVADYGHCDLAWSRYAPREIFPVVIDWLDHRQPGAEPARPQRPPPASRGCQRARRNASMQICDQVSNSSHERCSSAMGTNSGSARPSSRGWTAGLLQLQEMDDAQVNRPHGGGVVVDQADELHPAGAGHLDLLVQLAPHGHLVGLEAAPALRVRLGDVPPDPQRAAAVQPGLALRLAPGVAEDRIAGSQARRRG